MSKQLTLKLVMSSFFGHIECQIACFAQTLKKVWFVQVPAASDVIHLLKWYHHDAYHSQLVENEDHDNIPSSHEGADDAQVIKGNLASALYQVLDVVSYTRDYGTVLWGKVHDLYWPKQLVS